MTQHLLIVDDYLAKPFNPRELLARLHRKLENDPKSPEYIRTIWGAGYMFTPKGSMPG